MRTAFDAFCTAESAWLDDYALFSAIKETEHYRPWNEWPNALRFRDSHALESFRLKEAARIERIKFTQWIFFSQSKYYSGNKKYFLISEKNIRQIFAGNGCR